jgi:hypothetical protein
VNFKLKGKDKKKCKKKMKKDTWILLLGTDGHRTIAIQFRRNEV